MNTERNASLARGPSPDEQIDLLVGRIADGEASAGDWETFGGLAERSPGAWKLLAQTQRDHQALSLAVGVALHGADRVELPSREAAQAFLRGDEHARTPAARRVFLYGGWAVAAMIALAALGVSGGRFTMPGNAGNQAGLIPANYFQVNSPDDALQLYRDQGKQSGRVLAEVPVLLESRPSATGRGYEVVFVRQIVERAQMDNLLRFAQDERGNLVPVQVQMPMQPGRSE